jgi:hypothetical protein
MSQEIDRLREQFRAGREEANKTRQWVILGGVIVLMGAGGGLAWSMLEPAKPARPSPVVAAAPAVPTEPVVERAKGDLGVNPITEAGMKAIAGGDVASAVDQVALYNTAMGKLRSCGPHMNRDAVLAAERDYDRRNASAFAYWSEITDRPWDYNPESPGAVMAGALTGQIAQAGAGRMMSFQAMMAGAEADLNPNECAKLRQDLRSGKYDLAAPPN